MLVKSGISVLALDVDGVFTDGRAYMTRGGLVTDRMKSNLIERNQLRGSLMTKLSEVTKDQQTPAQKVMAQILDQFAPMVKNGKSIPVTVLEEE